MADTTYWHMYLATPTDEQAATLGLTLGLTLPKRVFKAITLTPILALALTTNPGPNPNPNPNPSQAPPEGGLACGGGCDNCATVVREAAEARRRPAMLDLSREAVLAVRLG